MLTLAHHNYKIMDVLAHKVFFKIWITENSNMIHPDRWLSLGSFHKQTHLTVGDNSSCGLLIATYESGFLLIPLIIIQRQKTK